MSQIQMQIQIQKAERDDLADAGIEDDVALANSDAGMEDDGAMANGDVEDSPAAPPPNDDSPLEDDRVLVNLDMEIIQQLQYGTIVFFLLLIHLHRFNIISKTSQIQNNQFNYLKLIIIK